MAVSFIYDVCREKDGTGYKSFKSQKKAEAYALELKGDSTDRIQITRSGKGYPAYIYYL